MAVSRSFVFTPDFTCFYFGSPNYEKKNNLWYFIRFIAYRDFYLRQFQIPESNTVISVVLTTYNRKEKLEKTLKSLLDQKYSVNYEVIVIDNGSSDGTTDYLKQLGKQFGNLKLLEHGMGNVGPAKARNLGVKQAKGEIVAFTDDDCIPPDDWLKKIKEAFDNNPEIASAGGYLEAAEQVLKSNIFAQY